MAVKNPLFTAVFVLIYNTFSYAQEELHFHPPQGTDSVLMNRLWVGSLGLLLLMRYAQNCYQLVDQLVRKVEELLTQICEIEINPMWVLIAKVSALIWSFIIWKSSVFYFKCARENNCSGIVDGVFQALLNMYCAKVSCTFKATGVFMQIPIALLTLLSEFAVRKYPLAVTTEQKNPEGPDNNMTLWLSENVNEERQIEPAVDDDEERQIEPAVDDDEERQIEHAVNDDDEERQIEPNTNQNVGDGESEQVIDNNEPHEQVGNSSVSEACTPVGSSSTGRKRGTRELSSVSNPSPRRSRRLQEQNKTPVQ